MLFEHLARKLFGDQIEKNEMGGNVARMKEKRGACGVLIGKPAGKRPLGRPSRRQEDNTKMDLQEMGWSYGLD